MHLIIRAAFCYGNSRHFEPQPSRQLCLDTAFRKVPSVNPGVFLALSAYAVYAWGDALIKSIGGQLSVFEIGFFMALFTAIFLVLFKPRGETWRGFWRTDRPIAVHGRAISGLMGGVLGIFAFTSIPLAETYALIFVAPLFVTLLSVVLLKERVGPWRWAAVVGGFIGVLLVVRPGFRALELGHLAALTVALLGATTIILTRSLAREKPPTMLGVLICYVLAFNAAMVLATGITIPPPFVLLTLALIGACTAAGHRLQLAAIQRADANRIAPTHYSQMLWAVLLGAVFFNEFPDWMTYAGLAVIAASGLLTLLREQIRLGRVRWNRFTRNRL